MIDTNKPSAMRCYQRDRVHRPWIGVLGTVVLVLLSVTAHAQTVLVWSTGNEMGNTQAIAAWIQDSGHFSSVTGINTLAPMTLAQLTAYDRVFYFSNSSSGQDPVAIGNVLADLADTGRPLVLSTFSWANQGGNTLSGRIVADQLSPYVLSGGSLYTDVTMQSNDGSSFFDGVNSLSGYFHDNVALTPGATSHALWSDGESLLATKDNVVAINLFPDDFYEHLGGDYRRLFVNALRPIPEPSSLLLVSLAMCGWSSRRVRRIHVENRAQMLA